MSQTIRPQSDRNAEAVETLYVHNLPYTATLSSIGQTVISPRVRISR